MSRQIAEALVEQFEEGRLSRRQLTVRLMGLGAMTAVPHSAEAGREADRTFNAAGLDHIALSVRDVPRSRDFYRQHLGLDVIRDGGDRNCFLGRPDGFFLALFRSEEPGLDHYCYAVPGYDADEAERRLKDAGLEVRREGGRVYFKDPDGIEVQVAAS